jgi:hypothetical protein
MSKSMLEEEISILEKDGEEKIKDRILNLESQKKKPLNSTLKGKDATLKKNSAVVKKLRQFIDLQLDQKKALEQQVINILK